jgi:D-3-phosphoglycerate dehydrogenase/(S)-sulfolactate dehydrogenase
MRTIVITEDVVGPSYDDLAARRPLVRDAEAWNSPVRLRQLLANAEAVVVRNRTQVNQSFFEAAPRLKIVARAGVGLDNIDLEAANQAGVVVVAPIGANAASVAEHALAMALALSKQLLRFDVSTKSGRWDRLATQELSGQTWGLLSAGATARATARLARGIGMRVIAYDPFVDPQNRELEEIGIELASFEQVMSSANVLSVHLPHNKSTYRLLNKHTLGMLPAGALVINVGRGEVIDENALLVALETGRIGGAGLDVRGQEPPTPGVLENRSDVILTPHIAGITEQAQHRIAQILCREIDRILDGGTATCAVGLHSSVSEGVAR